MAHDVIATCPVCSGELSVTRLHCRSCGTALEGDFSVGRFGRLDREQLALLESFLRSRGNLREMERELGISYPTVRNRVESLVRALGLADGSAPAEPTERPSEQASDDLAAARQAILERLARHEIGADEAAAAIREIGEGPMTTTIQQATMGTELDLGRAGEVDVETYDIEIRLRGVDGTVASVRLTGANLAEEFRVEQAPGRVTIRPVKRWSFGRRRDVGPLELDVPRDARVRAGSASGSVLAIDLDAGGHFRSASGDIDLAGLGGDIDAASVSGGVRVRSAAPAALRVKTTSGRIDVVSQVARRVEAHAVSGSVSVAGRLTGDGPFTLDSVSGTLTIATDGAIRLMASTVSGRVRSELPQVIDVGRGRTLAIGGDGPVVGARTVSGDIHVVPLAPSLAAAPDGTARAAGQPEAAPPVVVPIGVVPVTPTTEAVAPDASAPVASGDPRLDVLRALERGDIDVAEASRRLATSEARDA